MPWLPFSFTLAFGTTLLFMPRVSPLLRIGLVSLFGGGSTGLWLYSGSHTTLVGVAAAAGIALMGVLVSAWAGVKSGTASMAPILLLILSAWLISYYSSGHGGANPMIQWLIETYSLSRRTAEILVVAVRKTIHFSYYGVVAWGAFAAANRNGAVGRAPFVLALVTTLVYACFDELRQSTQPDRIGSVWDVGLDLSGAMAVLLTQRWSMRQKA